MPFPNSPTAALKQLPALLLAAFASIPLAGIALSPQAMAQSAAPVYQQPERVLSVIGQGVVSIPTTLSQVSLGVTVQAPTAQVLSSKPQPYSTHSAFPSKKSSTYPLGLWVRPAPDRPQQLAYV